MTREHAAQIWPIIKAFGEGNDIQYNSDCAGWGNIQEPQFNEAPVSYRIKPEPHLRPWKPEEVPVGALYRNKGQPQAWTSMIITADPFSQFPIKFCWDKELYADSLKAACDCREYSIDHGKTWLPCGVEE